MAYTRLVNLYFAWGRPEPPPLSARCSGTERAAARLRNNSPTSNLSDCQGTSTPNFQAAPVLDVWLGVGDWECLGRWRLEVGNCRSLSHFLPAFRFSYQEPVVITKESDIMSAKFISSVLGVVIAAGGATHAAGVERIPRPAVPTNLEVSLDYKLFLKVHAVGTQNYICAPAATATGVDWLFIGPQATLFNDSLQQTGTHYQSRNPQRNNAIHATWQDSGDTSAVWATRRDGSLDANYVAPGCDRAAAARRHGATGRPYCRQQAHTEPADPAGQHRGRRQAAGNRLHAGNAEHAEARALPGRLLLLQKGRLSPYRSRVGFFEHGGNPAGRSCRPGSPCPFAPIRSPRASGSTGAVPARCRAHRSSYGSRTPATPASTPSSTRREGSASAAGWPCVQRPQRLSRMSHVENGKSFFECRT